MIGRLNTSLTSTSLDRLAPTCESVCPGLFKFKLHLQCWPPLRSRINSDFCESELFKVNEKFFTQLFSTNQIDSNQKHLHFYFIRLLPRICIFAKNGGKIRCCTIKPERTNLRDKTVLYEVEKMQAAVCCVTNNNS